MESTGVYTPPRWVKKPHTMGVFIAPHRLHSNKVGRKVKETVHWKQRGMVATARNDVRLFYTLRGDDARIRFWYCTGWCCPGRDRRPVLDPPQIQSRHYVHGARHLYSKYVFSHDGGFKSHVG